MARPKRVLMFLVDGFDPVMPATYADQLTAEEISDLVAYIQSLA